MDTDSKLILDALSSPPPARACAKRYMEDIEPDLEIQLRKDAISKMVKRKQQKNSFKKKYVSRWNNIDFLRYAANLLKNYDVQLDMQRRECDSVARIYDKLAQFIGERMTNYVLKDYIDWWISLFGPRLAAKSVGRPVSILKFSHENQIEQFIKSYSGYMNARTTEVLVEPDNTVSDQTIYETGGLPMLIMSRGIVHAYAELKRRNENNIPNRISGSLERFAKDVLCNVMKITIELAPYDQQYLIDFISLIQPYLHRYSITQYNDLNCQDFFKELK